MEILNLAIILSVVTILVFFICFCVSKRAIRKNQHNQGLVICRNQSSSMGNESHGFLWLFLHVIFHPILFAQKKNTTRWTDEMNNEEKEEVEEVEEEEIEERIQSRRLFATTIKINLTRNNIVSLLFYCER